jgi:hypothetical protein
MIEAPAPAGYVGDMIALALTFCAAEEQRRCQALLALRAEILSAATASAEAAICEARLAWWGDELGRLPSGQAAHPAARGVGVALDDPAAAIEYLSEWRVEAGNRLRRERPDSAELFAISAFRRYGTLLCVMELAAGNGDLAAARDAGHACAALEAIADSDAPIEPSWLATPPVGAAARDDLQRMLAGEARAGLGPRNTAAPLTRILHALADASLARVARGRPMPGRFALLWRAWREALAAGRARPTGKDD